jgi:hypothetical protein
MFVNFQKEKFRKFEMESCFLQQQGELIFAWKILKSNGWLKCPWNFGLN